MEDYVGEVVVYRRERQSGDGPIEEFVYYWRCR